MAQVAAILKDDYTGKKVESLQELIREENFSFPRVGELFDVVNGIKGLQQAGWIGTAEKVTRADAGCGNNTDIDKTPESGSKTWEPKPFRIHDSMCYTDLEAAWTEWGLRNGIDKLDLTQNDYFLFIAEIYGDAAEKDAFRFALFGNKSASVVGSGLGSETLTDYPEQNAGDYNIIDGYFKTMDDLIALDSSKQVSIPENAGANLSVQKALAPNRAFSVCDELIDIADARLLEKSDTYFLMTYSMYQNLRRYYRDTVNDESKFTRMENGFQIGEHDGIPVMTSREIDRILRTDFFDGSVVDRPNRVYLLSKSNNKFGVDNEGSINDLTLEYMGGNIERNYIKGAYKADFKHINDNYGVAAF